MKTAPKNTYALFVDPDNLSTVVNELKSCGFTNLKKDAAGPSAAITFNGTQADVESFVDYNSFELTEGDFILDRRAED